MSKSIGSVGTRVTQTTQTMQTKTNMPRPPAPGGGPRLTPKAPAAAKFAHKRINSKDLQIFTRQFATLINAGIPIVDSIKILGDGTSHLVIKEVSSRLRLALEQGKRLSEAMLLFPRIFDRLYCNMIRAGEEAGILDTILLRLAVYIEKAEKIKSQVKGAMIYPIIILSVAACVIAAILLFVVPQLQELFASAGGELPALTQMVIVASDAVKNYWYILIGAVGIVVVGLQKWFETESGSRFLDISMLKIPVLSDLVLKSSIARMTRTLSTLLAAGVGVVEALEIAAKTSGNYVVEMTLLRCKESVIQGKSLAAPLGREKLIPDMVSQMIGVGEQSGTIDQMTGKIADFYEEEVEVAVKNLTSVIEPILMVFLGVIIAVLVVAMYLPIFKMGEVIGGQ